MRSTSCDSSRSCPDHAGAGTRTVARLHLVDPSDTDESTRANDPTSADDLIGTDPSRTDLTRTLDPTAASSVRSDPARVDLRSVTTWLGLVLGVRLLERA